MEYLQLSFYSCFLLLTISILITGLIKSKNGTPQFVLRKINE